MISRLHIIYDNLLVRLADYTEPYAGFQAYYDALPDQQRMDRLFELAETIANQQVLVEQSRDAVIIHAGFQPLFTALTELANEFPDYPAGRIPETLLMIKIIDKIEQEVAGSGTVFDLTVEVDEQIFCIEQITRPMRPSNFLFEDPAAIENSVILINLANTQEIQYFIDN